MSANHEASGCRGCARDVGTLRDLEDDFVARLGAFVTGLRSGVPESWSQVGVWRNDVYPLRLWASLAATPPIAKEEAAALSIDFRKADCLLHMSCGIFLASEDALEGPSLETALDDPLVAGWAEDAVAQALEFFVQNRAALEAVIGGR